MKHRPMRRRVRRLRRKNPSGGPSTLLVMALVAVGVYLWIRPAPTSGVNI